MKIPVLLNNVVIWVLTGVVGLGTTLMLFWAGRVEQKNDCQFRYNTINNTRSRVISEAQDQERDAERRADDAQAAVFTDPAIGGPKTKADRVRLEKLWAKYQDALRAQKRERAEADAARAAHPVPPPPEDLCG